MLASCFAILRIFASQFLIFAKDYDRGQRVQYSNAGTITAPYVETEVSMFRIRFHGRGGQGMKTASRKRSGLHAESLIRLLCLPLVVSGRREQGRGHDARHALPRYPVGHARVQCDHASP